MSGTTSWLCCGVLRAEMTELLRQGAISGNLVFLDSMLHMVPLRLQEGLLAELSRQREADGRVVLVFGDCSPHMLDVVRGCAVERVAAINCAQMLTGRDRYRELMRTQSFMVLPEWALRWRQIMQDELGLAGEVAHDFMRENRFELVYLDTGLAPVPRTAMEEFAAFSDLPWRIEPVGLDNLLGLLLAAEGRLP